MKNALAGLVLCALLSSTMVEADDVIVCEGTWKLDKIQYCENHHLYPIIITATKTKLDRYTDCLNAKMELTEDFGPEYVAQLEAFEKSDGGYKSVFVMTGSACEVYEKFGNETYQELLKMWDLEYTTPCLVPKGTYFLKDYVINYESFPSQSRCSISRWVVKVFKGVQEVACLESLSTFTINTEDDDDDDDEDE